MTREEVLVRKRELRPLLDRVDKTLTDKKIEQCNSHFFYDFKVRQAKEIVKVASDIFDNLPIAFSGGKDSLVVLHIALEIDPNFPVIYNDTTVEFPETIQYVRKLQERWGFDLHITKCETSFFKKVREVGWANHENRWCCRPYKDEPALEFMASRGFEAEITGTTRTESIYRRSLTPIKIPKYKPAIIRVHPIYDWNEWEVWRYIRENGLDYNPLYSMGYRRIGCWCCPLNGPSHYKRLKKTHPRLHGFLAGFCPPHPHMMPQ
jgi:phosphoadenosine phosphosulfate reductase